jgi:hypothetical protein
MLVNGASAQIQIQVQAKPVQVQAQPMQIQFQVLQNGRAINGMPVHHGSSARLSQADAIIVGRVVAFEPMDIEAAPAAGQPKATYRIAVIQLTESIFGLKKGTQSLRVGFVVAGNNGVNNPGALGGIQIQPWNGPALPGGLGRARLYNPPMNLTVGQDGLFFLPKHGQENFYLAPPYTNFVMRQENSNFDSEVKSAKRIAKVLENVPVALKGRDKQDRYIAAAVLVSKYRNNPTGLPMKETPIDATESRLILQAMAEHDWAVGYVNPSIPSPAELFNQLAIADKDGYKLVNARNQQDITQAMQEWVTGHSDKYVIKKLVADPNAK